MWKPIAILAALSLPHPALAEMTAEEFEAFTAGRTLFFALNGEDFGVERYKDNRRVEWSFLDGECTQGIWYEDNGLICFAYENWAVPQCWTFERSGAGLTARFMPPEGETPGNQYFAYEKDEEMICFGPDTGV